MKFTQSSNFFAEKNSLSENRQAVKIPFLFPKSYYNSGKHDRYHAKKLDKNVNRRTGCILEGITYSITNN